MRLGMNLKSTLTNAKNQVQKQASFIKHSPQAAKLMKEPADSKKVPEIIEKIAKKSEKLNNNQLDGLAQAIRSAPIPKTQKKHIAALRSNEAFHQIYKRQNDKRLDKLI